VLRIDFANEKTKLYDHPVALHTDDH